MKTFNISLEIQAEDENQLTEKLQAFQDLQDNLEHEDLLDAVDIVVENPDLVDFIKEVAPKEGEKLSLIDVISIAKKAHKKFS